MTALGIETPSTAILQALVEGQAYRQLLVGNIRGHGIGLLPNLGCKQHMSANLERSLEVMTAIEGVYTDLGGSDLVSTIRPRIDRVSVPQTRHELSVCLALLDRAERVASSSLLSCSHAGIVDSAEQVLGTLREEAEAQAKLFIEACTHPGQRASAQTYWSRWFAVALRSLDRLGLRRENLAAELGLCSATAAAAVRRFVIEVEPMRSACGLKMPSLDQIGIEMPEDLRGRFTSSGLHA